ncbi:MAG: DUF2815 family protein [Oscillospiraceae bacterium]|nr:DUF2815 family protein [Oscillospiraceae bacterium]
MAKKNERVFIRGARLSFPALDEPREAMAGQGDPKYQATFLLEPSNPSVPLIQRAVMAVASAMWGDRAAQVLQNPEKNPLKRGTTRNAFRKDMPGCCISQLVAKTLRSSGTRTRGSSLLTRGASGKSSSPAIR